MHSSFKIKTFHFKLTTICLSFLLIQQGYADNVQSLSAIQLQAIDENQNTEKTKKYIVKQSTSASKLNLLLKETPQTINVVTQQQMKDFNLTSLRDVLSSTAGIKVSSQETNRTTYTARGFNINNFQIDGQNMPIMESDYQTSDVDPLLYDHIEVIKGANGLISSIGNPSATVNFVRKRPTKEFQINGMLNYGSWDTSRIELDTSSSLTSNQKVRARLMAAQETGNSYLDHYKKEKTVIGTIFEADLTDQTLLTFGFNFQKDRPNRNNWGALPMLNSAGEMLSYARSYNPMPDWVHWDVEKKNAFLELKYQFTDAWSIQTSYNYNEQKEDGALLYFLGSPNITDGSGVYEYPSIFNGSNKNHHIEMNTQGKYSLFGQLHELMFGASWSKNKINQSSFYIDGRMVPITDWYHYQIDNQYPDFDYSNHSLDSQADYTQEQKRYYAATRLHLGEKLKFLAGINYTDISSEGQSYGNSSDFKRSKTLPYAGITYEFNPTYTAYASYSSIFKPTALLGLNKQRLEPTEGTSYEIGIKGSWFNDQLLVSSAVFKNEFDKFPVYAKWDQANLYSQESIKSQGYEFNIAGQLTENINVSSGYVQQNMKNKTTNEDVRTFVPSRIFNLMATYIFPQFPQLKLGANLSWQDQTSQSKQSKLQQSGYALLDLMTSYSLNDHITIQANIKNVTNKKYLNTLEYGQSYYGAPTNYNVALQFKY